MHFNAAGHQVVARALFEWFEPRLVAASAAGRRAPAAGLHR
jgi:hypothetical protein